MSEFQAVASTLVGLKAAGDLVKALLDVQGAIKEQGKVFELQRIILAAHQSALAAQEAQASLLKRINELEQQIADFETWESDKQHYQLEDVGNGSLAYVLKEEPGSADQIHKICANCYQHRQKSILQPLTRSMSKFLFCPSCKTEIYIGFHPWPEA
jgi:hypothetical protein